ncbi:MAG: hypothetical protein ACTIJJ_06975 [Galactobacter sp.]
MHLDFVGLLDSLWQVLAVGLIFGAGLPALFAAGIRALGTTSQPAGTQVPTTTGGNKFLAWVCFGLCIAAALFGIVLIVFGKQMFG